MAKKFRLLLLDANIVIESFRLGIWDSLLERCDVHLAQIVVDESLYYLDDGGARHPIGLQPSIAAGTVTVFDPPHGELAAFTAKFKPGYVEKLDDGEAASLTHLTNRSDDCLICSADAIVYRVLGNLKLSEQGLSLEEILSKVGLGRALDWKFSKAFREHWTNEGFRDGLAKIGTV
jgi:hypothetical protein